MEFTMVIEGYLAKDAVYRTFDDGNAVTNLRVLHTRRFFDADGGAWVDGRTISIDVACWRELAEPHAELAKGTKVRVECADVDARAYNGRGYVQANARKLTIIAPPKNRADAAQPVPAAA